jgi:hypothetical protein
MYLNGRIRLDAFEDWVVENTWNIHLENDPSAARIAFAIEESLAEFSSRHISESELKNEFRSILLAPPLSAAKPLVVSFPSDNDSRNVRAWPIGSVIVIREPEEGYLKVPAWDHQVLV